MESGERFGSAEERAQERNLCPLPKVCTEQCGHQLCRKSVVLTLFCILSRLSYSGSENVLVGSRMSAFGDRTDGPNRRRVSSGPQDFPLTQV